MVGHIQQTLSWKLVHGSPRSVAECHQVPYSESSLSASRFGVALGVISRSGLLRKWRPSVRTSGHPPLTLLKCGEC